MASGAEKVSFAPLTQRQTPSAEAQPPLKADAALLRRLLDVIENEVLPKTTECVAQGNKVFGAAILDGEGKTVVADTNHEITCPLFHGEVYCIQQWSAKEGPKPTAGESIFLATHEPCCLCVSAIVWAGFKKCFFLYPYETTRDQGIPHDINILHELWNVDRYVMQNKFLATAGIVPLVEALESEEDKTEFRATIKRVTERYDALSSKYHSEKGANSDNSLAFD